VCGFEERHAPGVGGLPANTSSDIVYLITYSIPIYDECCRRFINFVHSVLNSECRLVECVVRHGLCISSMQSFISISRNTVTYSLRYVSLLIAFINVSI